MGYYDEKLSAARLRRVYEVATPRVRRYLEAEIGHVASFIEPGDAVLETGCGYGRALAELADAAGRAFGIDTSFASLKMATETFGNRVMVAKMNAAALGFADGVFDLVACIQNGISAFKADRATLMREAVRVAKPGGRVFFSSYAARFWDDRMEWFERQAAAGLLGEIDHERTGDGVIICKDGFRAYTVGPEEFSGLAASLGLQYEVYEVDGSSLFCEIGVN